MIVRSGLPQLVFFLYRSHDNGYNPNHSLKNKHVLNLFTFDGGGLYTTQICNLESLVDIVQSRYLNVVKVMSIYIFWHLYFSEIHLEHHHPSDSRRNYVSHRKH